MSGLGSRRTTDELSKLDVRKVRCKGLIAPHQERLELPQERELRITWTSMPQGGERPWFVCPGSGCRRRVALLYLGGRNLLLCRHHLDLAYPSQRESALFRTKRKAEKARPRLGPNKNPRPKGMHHSTFVRLANKYAEARREHHALYHANIAKDSERLTKQHL